MKLEEICGYLPYGLEGIWDDVYFIVSKFSQTHAYGKTKQGNNVPVGCFLNKFKPILRPLSDLIKPCLPDGKTPMRELFGLSWLDDADEWDSDTLLMYNISMGNCKTGHVPFWIITKLYEWHFDIHGLIEKGEAIDINTLP
jgi:hypothetical protein